MADAVVETAPGDENDDSWLYGDSNPDQTSERPSGVREKEQEQSDVADGAAVS